MLMWRRRCRSTVPRVDHEGLAGLPTPYRKLLALTARGLADNVIAEQLGVPIESLPMMRRLAERKLERLRRGSRS